VTAWPVVAHHLAAFDRANGLRFTRWAAAIALFGYLSLFPLAVLAFVIFGLILANYPEVKAEVETALADSIPLLFDGGSTNSPVDINRVAQSTVSAGVVSVVGLLFAGLGWIDATIEGTRRMLGAMRRPRNFLILRLQNVAALMAMGTVLILALLVALGIRSAGEWLFGLVGVEFSAGWVVDLSASLIVGLLVWLVVAAIYGLTWHRPQRSWRAVLEGSFMATLSYAILSQFAYIIVGKTLSNPVYGALAVAAALLLFIYFASAVLLYFACWVAVAEGAPESTEQVAFRTRATGPAILLPTTAVEETHDADDGGSGEPPAR
jgi:membrane protein